MKARRDLEARALGEDSSRTSLVLSSLDLKMQEMQAHQAEMQRRQAEEELVVSDFYRSHPEFDKTYGKGGYKLKNDDGKRWVKLPPGHSMPSWPPSFEDFM